MSKVLVAKNISKSFPGVDLLKQLSIDVAPGEAVAIMGKSGEGKSTLLHILGTLEAPSQGEIAIAGEPVRSANTSLLRNRHVGFIFQAFHLLEEETALFNVLMPAKIARKEKERLQRALDLLEQVGLTARKDVLVKHLSGGEKQRVAIARALCNDPELILADEPTGNLDHATSQGIHDLLINAAKKWGKALVVVTHDPELAKLCDRTLILKEGHLCTS